MLFSILANRRSIARLSLHKCVTSQQAVSVAVDFKDQLKATVCHALRSWGAHTIGSEDWGIFSPMASFAILMSCSAVFRVCTHPGRLS